MSKKQLNSKIKTKSLKAKIDQRNILSLVYSFLCPCEETYVWESTKLLELVFDHSRDVQSYVKIHNNCRGKFHLLNTTVLKSPSFSP